MSQIVYKGKNVNNLIKGLNIKDELRLMIVCGKSCQKLDIYSEIAQIPIKSYVFSDFSSNPTYENVVLGVREYRDNRCNAIMAIGGGSAMDVAKCVALFARMSDDELYINQIDALTDDYVIDPIIAIPTTAGTGSEATRFAVIYKDGLKVSVSSDRIIPGWVLFRPDVLKELPIYQRQATAFDALCHAIESMWSVNSNKVSQELSYRAIKMIVANIKEYIDADDDALENMLIASNIAGQAINITQTTAGHAMCYMLTHLYGYAHGHSAALCVERLWEYMISHVEKCVDQRGSTHLNEIFNRINDAFDSDDALKKYKDLVRMCNFDRPKYKEDELDILVNSVNLERLKNNPVKLEKDMIKEIYVGMEEK